MLLHLEVATLLRVDAEHGAGDRGILDFDSLPQVQLGADVLLDAELVDLGRRRQHFTLLLNAHHGREHAGLLHGGKVHHGCGLGEHDPLEHRWLAHEHAAEAIL